MNFYTKKISKKDGKNWKKKLENNNEITATKTSHDTQENTFI